MQARHGVDVSAGPPRDRADALLVVARHELALDAALGARVRRGVGEVRAPTPAPVSAPCSASPWVWLRNST